MSVNRSSVLSRVMLGVLLFSGVAASSALAAATPSSNAMPTQATKKAIAGDSAKSLLSVKMAVKPMDTSKAPTREDLIAAGQLGGHLFPTSPAEGIPAAKLQTMRNEFGQAIQSWNRHEYKSAYKSFQSYIKKYPDSPWAGEAELHAACEARYNGRYTEAEASFKSIIEKHNNDAFVGGRMLADKAKSRLGVLKVLQNNYPEALKQFSDLQSNAEDWRLRTYAANWLQRVGRQNTSDVALLDCGLRALSQVLKSKGRSKEAKQVLDIKPTGDKGQSLGELKAIATKFKYQVTALNLTTSQLSSIPLPAIVQVNAKQAGDVGHYWIVEKIANGVVTLRDPQIPRRFQQTLAEFGQEWSGDALVFAKPNGLPGKVLSQVEMDEIYGGCCGVQRPEDDLGDTDTGDDEDCSNGAPIWKVNPVNMNIYMKDTPMWYSPAYGPQVSIVLSYNSQSAIAQYEPFGNKWMFNYTSYLLVDPGLSVTVFMPDGRRDVYILDVDGVTYLSPFGINNKLVALAENHFELSLPNGDVLEYNIPDGTTSLQPFLVKRTDKNGLSLTFGYDANVNLTSITDATGKVTTLTYNTAGKVAEVQDPFGRIATFSYDADNNLTRLVDMGGYWTDLAYDADVYPTLLRNAKGEWKFKVEPASGFGAVTNYPAPGADMFENYRITVTDPEGNKEEYFYNGNIGYGWYVSPNHYVDYVDSSTNNYYQAPKTTYNYVRVYNNKGRISKITYPEGNYVSFTYSSVNGRKLSRTDSAGHVTQYTYNDQGRLASIVYPNAEVTQFSYDVNGIDLIGASNGLGSVSVAYDANRRPISITDINNNTMSITYNTLGQVSSTTDRLGHVIDYSYNLDNQLEQILSGTDVLATYSYDDKGRILSKTDASAFTQTYSYNDLNSVVAVTYPDGGAESFTYPTCPRLLETATSRGDHTYENVYNGLKQLIKSVSPTGFETKYQYDGNGNLLALIDANQNETTFSYDKNNRLVKKTYVDGNGISYQYNNVGKVVKRTNARGISTTYSYDLNGNLTKIDYSDSTPDVAYTYDPYSRLVQVQDGIGATVYTYNADSTVQSIDGPWVDDTISFTYDAMGRVASVTPLGGQMREYTYDSLNRLSQISMGTRVFSYQYLGPSRLVSSLTNPNGVVTNYGYDAMNRLASLTNVDTLAAVLTSYSYTYNASDYIASETNSGALAFNSQLRLKQFESNGLNQTNTKDEQEFQFDLDGNLISGYTPLGYSFTATYDAENRLVSVNYIDANGLEHRKEYGYAADHFLATIKSYQDTSLVEDIRIVRLGALAIQDRDGANVVINEYLWGKNLGGGIGGLLMMARAGQDYFYHYNGRGDVTLVTDTLQQKVAEYMYDEYGGVNNIAGTLDQPFQFSTKRFDSETGLKYFGYRFYSPEMSKWTTRDPLGEAGGLNLYAYVDSNPINFIDPYGEASSWWQRILQAAGLAIWMGQGGPTDPNVKPPPGPSRENTRSVEQVREESRRWKEFLKKFKGFRPPSMPPLFCPLCDFQFQDQMGYPPSC